MFEKSWKFVFVNSLNARIFFFVKILKFLELKFDVLKYKSKLENNRTMYIIITPL